MPPPPDDDKLSMPELRRKWKRMIEEAIKSETPVGPYTFLYTSMFGKKRPPIKCTVYRVEECVRLFGPSLYGKNPLTKKQGGK